MKIIVGLGNPGAKYETSRHNVGFLAVDRLVDSWRASGPISRNEGIVYQADVVVQGSREKVLLVKPQTFMNLSGKCVSPLFRFYQCEPQDLIVIHDDLDLGPLALRLKTGGGTGGHNGLKSIDEALGKDNTGYHRIRIGIGHPARLTQDDIGPKKAARSTADYVLTQFSDKELEFLDPVLDEVVQAAGLILDGQIKQAMNLFHRPSPEGPKS